jgi:hypothetical protein
MTTNFFSLLSFVAVFRSEIRDWINIPDPQHWEPGLDLDPTCLWFYNMPSQKDLMTQDLITSCVSLHYFKHFT